MLSNCFFISLLTNEIFLTSMLVIFHFLENFQLSLSFDFFSTVTPSGQRVYSDIFSIEIPQDFLYAQNVADFNKCFFPN